jgi:hypothetical protein
LARQFYPANSTGSDGEIDPWQAHAQTSISPSSGSGYDADETISARINTSVSALETHFSGRVFDVCRPDKSNVNRDGIEITHFAIWSADNKIVAVKDASELEWTYNENDIYWLRFGRLD